MFDRFLAVHILGARSPVVLHLCIKYFEESITIYSCKNTFATVPLPLAGPKVYLGWQVRYPSLLSVDPLTRHLEQTKLTGERSYFTNVAQVICKFKDKIP